MAIIDVATLNILGTGPPGPDPREVVASADGKLAYITTYTAGNRQRVSWKTSVRGK